MFLQFFQTKHTQFWYILFVSTIVSRVSTIFWKIYIAFFLQFCFVFLHFLDNIHCVSTIVSNKTLAILGSMFQETAIIVINSLVIQSDPPGVVWLVSIGRSFGCLTCFPVHCRLVLVHWLSIGVVFHDVQASIEIGRVC